MAASQSNKGVEKSAATKLPGRNMRATKARTFIEAESWSPMRAVAWVERAARNPVVLSRCVIKWKILQGGASAFGSKFGYK